MFLCWCLSDKQNFLKHRGECYCRKFMKKQHQQQLWSDYLLSGMLLSTLKRPWSFITSALCLFVGEVIPPSEIEEPENSVMSDFMAKQVNEKRRGDFHAAQKRGRQRKLSSSRMKLQKNGKKTTSPKGRRRHCDARSREVAAMRRRHAAP